MFSILLHTQVIAAAIKHMPFGKQLQLQLTV